jgi:hypothetical protein
LIILLYLAHIMKKVLILLPLIVCIGFTKAQKLMPQGTFTQVTIPGLSEFYSFKGDRFEKKNAQFLGEVYGAGTYTLDKDTILFSYDSIKTALGYEFDLSGSNKPGRNFQQFFFKIYGIPVNDPLYLTKFRIIGKDGRNLVEGLANEIGEMNLIISDSLYKQAGEIAFKGPGFSNDHYLPLPTDSNNVHRYAIFFRGDTGVAFIRPHIEKYVLGKVSDAGFRMLNPGAPKYFYTEYLRDVVLPSTPGRGKQ